MEHLVDIPLYSLIPFILMLASIAVLPLFAPKFWHKNMNKLIVSLVLGIPTLIWLLFQGMTHELEHAMIYDYVPFIILLGSLFVVTGGIYIKSDLKGSPKVNTIILGIGAVLASLMGTTGAAMLLIRPLMSTNANRKYKVHTILFFLAIAANTGGLLTPLGDPPLFMMYLRGAPFFWFAGLVKEWFFVNSILLILYYFVDKYYINKENSNIERSGKKERVRIELYGKRNLFFLLGIVLSVAFINQNTFEFIKMAHPTAFVREAVMLLMAYLSLRFTKQKTRSANHFSWEPIEEVAYLFLGIFITMVPCLVYLEVHAQDFGFTSPYLFYYATGLLSSFLDNTPTAVTFYSLAFGLTSQGGLSAFAAYPTVAGIPAPFMEAIATSSVFFGALTYIGNGPNFMVKAIAESNGIKMPEFFAYLFKFSLIVLLPIFILAQLIFIH
jgi:Na+/H+ antiporter NhaD/arsenite permease-like protein